MDWETVEWVDHDGLELGAPRTLWEHEGITLSLQPWRIEDSRGIAWRARIARSKSFTRVLASDDVQPFIDFLAPDDGPRIMINGGFYESSDDLTRAYEPMGVVRASGQNRHDYVHRGGSGILVVEPSGVQIVHRSKWKDHQGKQTTDALQSIDRIVDEGNVLVKHKKGKPGRFAARSGIALDATHIWVVVAVAERSMRHTEEGFKLLGTSYQGMPLWGFARYIVESIGAEQALNLDGAVSTQLEVRAGAHRFSLEGERGTINVVEFRPPRQDP